MPADGGIVPASVAPHPGRTTQLMYACSQGDLKQVQRILHDQPTSLHHLDRIHRTPLHYCAGGTTSQPSPTVVHPTARLSHCADLLLMAAPDLVHARDQDGFTPLHLAVIAGNVQLVQFLLANGADVQAKDGEMHSVVHWATVCGETAALQAVLAAGAQVSTPDVHGGYPLHYAAQMCGSEKPDLGLQVLHILLSSPGIAVSVTDNDGRQPLLWAASAGSARAVLALVRAGAAVEAADRDGLTALHCAASRGHTDTLDTLLTLCGAQTDVIDSNGCTALHYSVTLGHADATALLLSHSADPNLQDRKGRSPAHCGCAKGQLETVRQLHAAGANLWLRTARGDLPLHEAAASGRRQLVKWLLDQRPSQVNSRNNDGRGLLHLAALNDNADMCKILLDSGAAVNSLLRTSKNVFMTPLDCALQRGFRSTAKFLQLHGGVPANRLNTLRLSSEVASNVSAGSHLHIREDITVFGGSSSETDLEDAHRGKDHRGRRKTVRRKLSYRHERRRSFSGSEPEGKGKIRTKSSSKSAHEKISKKYEAERRARSKEDSTKLKKDGEQFKKKKPDIESENSLSDTETSPEIRRSKNSRTKTTESDRKKCLEEPERYKQSFTDKNGAISNLESIKKTIPSDYERKKSKKSLQDDSSSEISDTEKSRKVTSERERRKSKKHAKEDESNGEERKKNKKTRSSNEKQDSDNEQPKERKNKSSDVEVTNQKSNKSDISDAETQRHKISDGERKKKKSTDQKIKKEKSIQERDEKVAEPIEVEEKTASNNKTSTQEELDSQVKQETSLKTEEHLHQNQQNTTDSTKQERKASAKSVKQISTSKTESKSEETKSSTEEPSQELTQEAAKDSALTQQEPEDSKQLEEHSTIQPDQISLQSKLSEESPSKTIVVEAAVHHPPKGMSTEDIHEEPTPVVDGKETVEDDKGTAEEVKEKVETVQEVNTQVETVINGQSIEDGTVEAGTGENGTVEASLVKEGSVKDVSIKDSTVKDGTVKDGIVEDGTVKDGSVEDKPKVKVVEKVDGNSEQVVNNVESSAKETTIPEHVKINIEKTGASENKEITNETQEVDESVSVTEKNKIDDGTSPVTEENVAKEIKQDEQELKAEEAASTQQSKVDDGTEESSTLETKETTSSTVDQEVSNDTDLKTEEIDSKKLNIDLSLKKFEESADLQDGASDGDEHLKDEADKNADESLKQKKYRKKVKISKNKIQDSTAVKDSKPEESKPEDEEESTSTSRETSSSETDSEKSVKKISETKNGEHKSFKVLKEDVAFEVLKDSVVKEPRRVRKTSKKRQKESERLNESATSSPEMLESARTRSKSVPRHKDVNQNVSLPSLVEKRPESNLSAPNLSSVYSDNEQKSASNSEADDLTSSASRKRKIKRRSKLRVGSKSAGSDYESSNLIDSGFEPSPRSSRIPKRKVMSERGVNMTSVTQQIQSNIRKYHMERKIFQHLLDLKRLQIRSGQANESVLVKRAIDGYHNSVAATVGAGRYKKKDYTYRSFEQFLYQSLRMLQKSPVDHMKGLPETPDNPLLCTQSTHRCLHATHAYTGIPCAAYLPKMNHHTMPKIGFTPRSSSSFLPAINSKGKSVTLELCHGNDKQVISLPADRLDHNKRYYVTFTVKGQEGPSPVNEENPTSHRHAKSV